jgi:hypothetical protein
MYNKAPRTPTGTKTDIRIVAVVSKPLDWLGGGGSSGGGGASVGTMLGEEVSAAVGDSVVGAAVGDNVVGAAVGAAVGTPAYRHAPVGMYNSAEKLASAVGFH